MKFRSRSVVGLVLFLGASACAKKPPAPAPSAAPAARAASRSLEGLDGEWRGTHRGGNVVLAFHGNRAEAQVGYLQGSQPGRFVIDTTHSPAWLDFDWDQWGHVETIIERVGPDRIRIQSNDAGQPRPTAFTPDNVLDLTRVTQSSPQAASAR